jgi:hypothetical protein
MISSTLRSLIAAGTIALTPPLAATAQMRDQSPAILAQAEQDDAGRLLRRLGLGFICNNPKELQNYDATCRSMRDEASRQACFQDKAAVCGQGTAQTSPGSATSDGIIFTAVAGSGKAFVEEVKTAIQGLPSYTRRIGALNGLEIIAANTVVDGAKQLGMDFSNSSPEQIAIFNSASGLHVHASGGVDHPVIFIPQLHVVSFDASSGKIDYKQNLLAGSSVNHESGHDTLHALGVLLGSPADANGRQDFSYDPKILDLYKKEVVSLMRASRALADEKGAQSAAYRGFVDGLEEIQWMLPPDAWKHIVAGDLTKDTKVAITPEEVKLGAKEMLAQAVANAYGTDNTLYGKQMAARFRTHLPGMAQEGTKIHTLLESYSARHADDVDFQRAIQAGFTRDFEGAPMVPLRKTELQGARLQAG